MGLFTKSSQSSYRGITKVFHNTIISELQRNYGHYNESCSHLLADNTLRINVEHKI